MKKIVLLIDDINTTTMIKIITLFVIITTTTSSSPTTTTTTNNTSSPPCRFYLSLSTLSTPHHPQLGIFSTISLPPNATLPTPPSLSLPLTDAPPHHHHHHSPLQSQLWAPERTLSQFLARSVQTILPGLPSLTPIPPRDRTTAVDLAPPWPPAATTSRRDAGAGSRTESRVGLVTTRRVRPGQEIFLDLGVDFNGEEEEGPTEEDRRRADDISRRFRAWREDYEPSPEEGEAAWRLVRTTVVRIAVVRELLPLTGDEVTSGDGGGGLVAVSRLREEGVCYDQWEAKESPMGVGWGAFATRDVREGAVVGVIPLIPIATEEWGGERRQLVVNYCFGSPKVPFLLYPLESLANYVNHGGPAGANAKIRWSEHFESVRRDDWRRLTLEELTPLLFREDQHFGGFMFDLVATRDLRPGEEILIDYGPSWAERWEAHQEQWKAPDDAARYVPPQVFMESDEGVKRGYFRTRSEQSDDPYPANLVTACVVALPEQPPATAIAWRRIPKEYRGENTHLCLIEERLSSEVEGDVVEYSYNVRVLLLEEKRHVVVNNVMSEAISFVDRPYASHLHLEGAFRHYIEIPENMIPEAWLL